MKHISVNKPLKRRLRGNATGLNMMGGKTRCQYETSVQCSPIYRSSEILSNPPSAFSSQPCLQMKGNRKKQASGSRNPTPKEVNVVLSSDDDDEEETEALTRRVTLPSRAAPDTSDSCPSPPSGSVEPSTDDGITSDFFASSENIPKIKLPRRMLMRNQLGKLRYKKPSAQQTETKAEDPPPALRGGLQVDVDCRLVRVGTLRRQTGQPVTFNTEYIQLDHQVCVPAEAVTSCELCLSRTLPSVLLKTTPGESLRLRYHLNMFDGHGGGWFDSTSPNLGEKYIILVFMDLLPTADIRLLGDILKKIGRENGVDDFVRKITVEEASKILIHGKTDSLADGTARLWSSFSPPACRNSSSPKTSANKSFLTAASRTPLAFQQAFLDHSTASLPSAAGQGTVPRMHPYPPRPMFTPRPAASHKSPTKARLRPRMPPTQSPSAISSSSSEDEDVLEVFTGPVKRLIVYPPPPARGGLAITNEDLHCLNKGLFLNDVIIDFYLKYLVLAELSEEDVKRSHIFSSFFYKRLTQTEHKQAQGPDSSPKKMRHSRVRTWTKNVDLFQKDFIFVPINEAAHWFLAVICFPGREVPQPSPGPLCSLRREDGGQDCSKPAESRKPCILTMDSLGGHHDRVVEILQEYLEVEWEARKGSQRRFCGEAMAGCRPSVPQQDNFSDCGVFLLQYVQSFLQNPPCSFTPPMDLAKWFPTQEVENKRGEIRNLILEISQQQERDVSSSDQ